MTHVLPSREGMKMFLGYATNLARGEIIVALRAPQQKIIGLLLERSKDLAQIDALIEEHEQPNWGTWG